jgi:cyclopropane fatty-acyl-phospholipid synthase-like methyltransferase
MDKKQIPTIDWTDRECVAEYLGVYAEQCDAAVPQQLERIGDVTGMTFVDLGCGQGTLLIRAGAVAEKCIGVDISPRMCQIARGKADAAALSNVSVICATLSDWTAPPESIDVVWSRSAIHHLPDREKAALFRAIHQALRPGGRFLMEDLMFKFGYSDYERQLPRIAELVIDLVGTPETKAMVERDAFSTLYKEHPSPTGVLRALLETSGFAEVSCVQQTSFIGTIEARK